MIHHQIILHQPQQADGRLYLTIIIAVLFYVSEANHLSFGANVANQQQPSQQQQQQQPDEAQPQQLMGQFIPAPSPSLNLNNKNLNHSNNLNHHATLGSQTSMNQFLSNNDNNFSSSNNAALNFGFGKDEAPPSSSQQQTEQQNQFQSSISCGQLEFYVQLTFNKPFKGLLYAYKMYQNIEQIQPDSTRVDHYYYPLEILDTCTIKGNGASIVYLELSFLSECVEKLSPLLYASETTNPVQNQTSTVNNNDNMPNNTFPYQSNEYHNSHTFNLDGFHFRRALNENLPPNHLNISKDDIYQLSLYVQNDPKIEQKYDSKVVIQCSPRVTKNIILEQNQQINEQQSPQFYRKVDQSSHNSMNSIHQPHVQRTIMPMANLTVTPYYANQDDDDQYHHHHHQQQPKPFSSSNKINVSHLIESRMDILKGRIPFLKLIDGNVELGDDVTLIIRSRQLDDYDSKISNCYAYDERDTMRFQLTNQDGCPVDPTVMQAFKILHNVGSESKVYYTTFSAFKFPGSQYLNIQCTLLVCRQICPKPTCEQVHQ